MTEPLISARDGEVLRQDTCTSSDYLVSVACGALAGLIDIFFVGAPGESVLGEWTDQQVDNAVMKFAKWTGWSPRAGQETNVASAIGFLERKFPVNYDQRNSTDVGGAFSMGTKNHHIKSLAHCPDAIGLFFSILNQFTGTSSFVSGGQVVTIQTDTFELKGHNLISKLFCGTANWFGHIMSDIAGSSGSRGNTGRGTGVGIPFFELFQFCNVGSFQIGKARQDLATLSVRAFQEGYDARFGLAMAIPTLLCDLLIRLVWMLKRYFSLHMPLAECIPSQTHADLRVMLLFGHGTLCVMDGADAATRSGGNWLTFFLRMNLIAWTRFVTLVLKEICIRAGIALPLQRQLDSYRRVNEALHAYYLKLQEVDLAAFQTETEQYQLWSGCLERVYTQEELNILLRRTMIDLGIDLPWEGDFDAFMQNRDNHLVFE